MMSWGLGSQGAAAASGGMTAAVVGGSSSGSSSVAARRDCSPSSFDLAATAHILTRELPLTNNLERDM